MPTPPRRPIQPLDTAAASPDWARLVGDALAHGIDAATDETTRFHCAFPLGEAIGERFRQRAASGRRPLGLIDLIDALVPGAGADAPTRRALLAGLCWNLEEVVGIGSRLTRELAEPPAGDPLDAARERAQTIARELRRRER